jgi:manganese efflux pump family protein
VAALLLLAVAVGLSNFAGAIGIGVSGVTGRLRLRIAVLFGLFEAGMPVLGLLLGHGAASGLGRSAPWLGGALLIAVGLVSLVVAWRGARGAQGSGAGIHAGSGAGIPAGSGAGVSAGSGAGIPAGSGSWGTWRVLVSAIALSLDNLAAGFALGTFRVGLAVAVPVFGVVSVVMSLAGLELGARIGAAAGDRGELIACAMLVGVGAAMAAGVF